MIRNINRIPRIINKLWFVWVNHPDLRLGQLIDILRRKANDKSDDFFFIEDETIERELDRMMEE